MSSVRLQDAYAVGGAGPRGISTSYSIPLDGSPFSLGPFPFTPRGISIINQSAGVVTVNDDRGASYVANALTATTFGLGPTLYLTASVSPAQTSGKVTVIVYDSPQAIASAQLAALAPAGSNIQRVSSLPTSPFDGQVVSLVVDPVNFPGVEWLLIYNLSTLYWDVIGGSPLTAIITTSETANLNNVWGDLATVGPSITLARQGDYVVQGGAHIIVGAGADNVYAGAAIGAGVPIAGFTGTFGSGVGGIVGDGTFGPTLVVNVPANTTYRLRYLGGNQNNTWGNRRLVIMPIRIK